MNAKLAVAGAILLCAIAAPAFAGTYPVSGKWGQSASSEKGAIDCKGKRVIAFNGNQRTDSNGGVPAYRNRTVTLDGPSSFRVVDEFATGQISGRTSFTLRKVDADHIELAMQGGTTLKLQRCK
jgi:hypothetical protein